MLVEVVPLRRNETRDGEINMAKLGKFKQVRPDTHLGRIATAAVGGDRTLDEIAAAAGRTADQVKSALVRARVTHGIDHSIDADGTVSLIGAELFNEPAPPAKEKIEGAPRKTMAQAMLEAARQGTFPAAPDFSAETHKRWRPKLARLVELVAARDVAGLRAYEIKPISSSPRALERYRDAAVAAIEATPRAGMPPRAVRAA
jgi:hypothetical protein